MRKYVFILLVVVAFAVPSHGAACGVTSSHNISCTQLTPLSGGLCANTLNSAITVTAGDRLIAWTDNDSTTTAMSAMTDGVNTWTKIMPSKAWLPSTSPTNFDQVWTTVAQTSATLNIHVTCPASFEIIIAEFRSSVGTVGIDCNSSWVAYDGPSNPNLTSTCTPARSNDFGLGVIDWGAVNPTPVAPWIAGSNDTEDGTEMQALGAAAVLTGNWTGNATDRYVTSVFALNDGSPATRYISQSGGVFSGGSSCNGKTAISVATFNATTSVAGDVNMLCGTITSELTPLGGGSSAAPAELLFDTGAKIQISPGMDSNGIIHLGSDSFWLIDGGTACGWNTATNLSEGACNGSVKNALYGSSNGVCPAGTCTTQFSQTGVSMINGTGSNIEIRNLDIGPCYVHTATGAGFSDQSGGCGTITDESGSNWNIHDNKIHDGAWSVNIQFNSGNLSNITVANNEMYNNSHHFAIDGGNHTIDTFTVSGNYAHDMFNWDTTGDAWHANFIHFFTATGAGTASNIAVYNNIIGGNTGADVTAQFIFSEQFTTFGPFAVFNNLAIPTTSPDLGGSNHFWGPSQCNTGCFIYNNTMARQTETGGNLDLGFSGTMAATIKNNVMQNASTNIATPNITLALTFDYNAYGPSTSCWDWKGTFTCTFATWKSLSGGDSHAIFNNSTPYVTSAGSYKPPSGSTLIGAGVNVCVDNPSFCTTYPAIKNDLAGVARPVSLPWDIGAFQATLGFSASPTTIPSNHSGNIAVVLTGNGTSWNGSTAFSVSGVTGATLVSKSNTSATSETLQISTGSGTGTLTITDTTDSLNTAITVAAATLSVSPSLVGVGKTPTVTLTGTNTLWSSETAAGLFSVSGGTGSSIGTPTVTSNTSATATLTVGSSAGTETITDNSTTATGTTTAAFAIAPTCDHITGTYPGSFSNKCSTTSAAPVILCWSTTTTPATNGLGTGCTTGTVLSNNGSTTISGSENFNIVSGTSTLPDSSVTTYAYTITGLSTGGSISNGAQISNGAVIR